MSTTRKLKTLTLREKSEVINAVKSGMKKKDVAALYGLPASTLSTIIKNKAEILQRLRLSSNLSSKRRRLASFPDLEDRLLTWLKQCRDRNISVSGPVLREKAQELSKSMGHSSFGASNGWLGCFKKRHELVFKKDGGESASVNKETCDEWEMSERSEKHLKIQDFLSKILELRNDLFGQFSPTKDCKNLAWSEVHQYAIDIGLIGFDKDVSYVRDTTWPNLKNRTLSRIDQSQRTGHEGNSDSKIDDTDKLVLEIIGKESPVEEGIGVPDSTESGEASTIKEEDVTPSPSEELSPSLETIDVAETSKKTVLVIDKTDTRNLNNLNIRKLKIEIRKLELEVWEKERNLNISHCNLTRHIDPLEVASAN